MTAPTMSLPTILVFGDQLNRQIGALGATEPGAARVLLIESDAKVEGRGWHRQRLHLILASMARFAGELTDLGFEVDWRRAATFADGLAQHRAEFDPTEVIATEPNSRAATTWCEGHDVRLVRSDQFLCHRDDFAAWADAKSGKRLRMEDFYRQQRVRLDVLMDGAEPAGGVWNLDHDNRERPPKDGRSWPAAEPFPFDALDHRIIARLPATAVGAEPVGIWPTTRAQALERLDAFIAEGLPRFGPHEDAMLATEWKLAHSVLSSSLNIGLLLPGEVIEAAEDAYRSGAVPLTSAEGFIRQIIGWREYVWGLYWWFGPEYEHVNDLGATRPLPPGLMGTAPTEMACVANVIAKLDDYGWTHHIERLMVLGNLALLAGVDPHETSDWMWERFVDGAEWVMLPNVMGMSQHADGGRMATKPYASGGGYIKRMSDHCRDCRFDPTKRTGPTACPFTTLYWDFLARNEAAFRGNNRLAQPLAGMRRLSDLPAVRQRAVEVLTLLDAGEL